VQVDRRLERRERREQAGVVRGAVPCDEDSSGARKRGGCRVELVRSRERPLERSGQRFDRLPNSAQERLR
jgi:hypothetical protein